MALSGRDKQDSFYARLFAKAYDPVMHKLEEQLLLQKRRALISGLQGRILEVGAGTGINFPLYTEGANVLALEPSPAMLQQATQRLTNTRVFANIEMLQAGVQDDQLEDRISPGSLDVVVCTLVLCTIPDIEQALFRFRTWLQPEGKLLVLEHIHDHRQPQRWLQHQFTPVWKHLAEGCHLNRATDERLKQAGFTPLEEGYIYTRFVPFYWARMVVK